MLPVVDSWCLGNTLLLRRLADVQPRGIAGFLRVVTRTFRAKSLDVSVSHTASRQGDLNAKLVAAQDLASGDVKVEHLSGRTVRLQETFKTPLVIGYHAVDLVLLDDGSTVLSPYSDYQISFPVDLRVAGAMTERMNALVEELASRSSDHGEAAFRRLVASLSASASARYSVALNSNMIPMLAFREAVVSYFMKGGVPLAEMERFMNCIEAEVGKSFRVPGVEREP